ncbi:MAG: Hsp20/alpha crystallin family protein [Cyclobacteriaceae bacterium]
MENVINKSGLKTYQNFFDDFLTKDLVGTSRRNDNTSFVPLVNILESNEDFRIELGLPGMNKNDFKIELDNQVLTVTSDVNQDQERNNEINFLQREFNFHSFSRSFQLPETINTEKIDAKYLNGMLVILIPKKEEAKRKPIKAINIS